MVEILRTGYIGSLHYLRIDKVYAITDYIASGLYLVYIILKISANDGMSESKAQLEAGWFMAVVWGFVWALILLAIIYEVFVIVKRIFTEVKAEKETISSRNNIPTVTTMRELMKEDYEESGAFKAMTARGKEGGMKFDADKIQQEYQVQNPSPLESPSARRRSNLFPSDTKTQPTPILQRRGGEDDLSARENPELDVQELSQLPKPLFTKKTLIGQQEEEKDHKANPDRPLDRPVTLTDSIPHAEEFEMRGEAITQPTHLVASPDWEFEHRNGYTR